jgi:hypothetical protein
MRIVISKFTDSVFKDGASLLGLELPIPNGIRSLYFTGTSGWIEYFDKANEVVTNLPAWAQECLTVYEEAVWKSLPENNQPVASGVQTL